MKRLGSFRIKLIFTSGKVRFIISSVLALSLCFPTYFSLHCFPLVLQGSPVISILIHSCSQIVFFFSKCHIWKCLHRGCSAELLLGWVGTGSDLCFFLSHMSGYIYKGGFGAFLETLTAFKGVLYKLRDPPVFPIYQYIIKKMHPWYGTALCRNTRT